MLSLTVFPESSTLVSLLFQMRSLHWPPCLLPGPLGFLSPSHRAPCPLHSGLHALSLASAVRMQSSTSRITSSHSPLSSCHFCLPVYLCYFSKTLVLVKTCTDLSVGLTSSLLCFRLSPLLQSEWTCFSLFYMLGF